jgi:hypothetical protein
MGSNKNNEPEYTGNLKLLIYGVAAFLVIVFIWVAPYLCGR